MQLQWDLKRASLKPDCSTCKQAQGRHIFAHATVPLLTRFNMKRAALDGLALIFRPQVLCMRPCDGPAG